ncbi:hypothetical protein CPB86DRAFT_128603 [Serendipita vermifera]|nr:hypothetical protein CPB86DRAFT_128603 [Serendipita vermifera]
MSITIRKSDAISFASDLPPNLKVRELEIHILEYRSLTLNEAVEDSDNHVANVVETLIKLLLNLMQNINRLRIHLSIDSWSIPLFELGGLFSGTKLTLVLPNAKIKCSNVVEIPSSTIRLTLLCDSVVARSLSSNTLKSLSIHEPYGGDSTQEEPSTLIFNLDHWPALQSISLQSDLVAWSKFSLAFLSKVTILRDSLDPQKNDKFTYFIKAIACRPDSYPSLEEIELGECPELDILMIILERRNLLQGPGIKKIRQISFPSSCSNSIRKIISTLLAGKWAERPSNKDLSLAGNVEILLDLTLPGCYMCHRGLRYCDAPVGKTGHRVNIQDSLEALKVYPDNEDGVISSWNDRALLWESIDRNSAGRLRRCGWLDNGEYITADSL